MVEVFLVQLSITALTCYVECDVDTNRSTARPSTIGVVVFDGDVRRSVAELRRPRCHGSMRVNDGVERMVSPRSNCCTRVMTHTAGCEVWYSTDMKLSIERRWKCIGLCVIIRLALTCPPSVISRFQQTKKYKSKPRRQLELLHN